MRRKNQRLSDSILAYVDAFYLREGRSPYITEIAETLEVNKSQVHRYLLDLQEQGVARYSRGKIITATIEKVSPSNLTGVVGSVPCGIPDERQAETVEELVRLPVSLFGTGELYILRASGESMIDAGIDDGDLVVVRKTETAEIGEIVVALTDQHESTLKRLIFVDGKKVLHPENDRMEDIVTPFSIQGVAIYVMKQVGKIL